MKQINNEDFENLEQVIGYLTILFDDWKNDNSLTFPEKELEENQKHFDNAIKYIKDLGGNE